MSDQKRMHVLDFIINVLKVHEKELDNKINRLETNIERIENLIRTTELLILQENPEDMKLQVRELLAEILETPFSL
jgi:archaellum component FlaC